MNFFRKHGYITDPELKKEIILLKEYNNKMVKLIGKEMRRSLKIISDIDEDEVFDEDEND